jgi:hypothetical protein
VSELENTANAELTKNFEVGKREKSLFQRQKFKSNADDTSQKERKRGLGSIFEQQNPSTS